MEAGASAAGDGNEHQRPGGQAGGAMHGPFDVAVEGVPLEGQSAQQPNGHEHQQYSEERIDAADDLVHGQNSGKEVVRKDDRHKEHTVHTGQLGQQASGPRHEDHAHQNEQHDGEHAHELLDEVAKVVPDDIRHGLAVITDGQHPREVVMYGTGEHASDYDPQESYGTVEGTKDRSEDGAKTGNVQQLDQKHLGRAHLHIVHTVRHFAGRRGAVGIRPEHLFHNGAIHTIPSQQPCQGQHKIHP